MKTAFTKRANVIISIFCVFLLITLSLLSLVCYLSFDQNYREVKQSTYSALSGQIISDMETSISYGKRIDRYFGIEDVFERTQELFGEEYAVIIVNANGEELYRSDNVNEYIQKVVASEEMQLALQSEELTTDAHAIVSRDGYEVLIMPVDDAQERVGYFMLSYPQTVYAAQRAHMLRQFAQYLGIAFVAGLAVMLIYYLAARKKMESANQRIQRIMLFVVPSVIIIVFIVIMGAMNYVLFRDRYETAVEEDARAIAEYVSSTTQELYEKGVPYEEMYGVETYLAQKVEALPVLWNLRITQVVSDSDMLLERGNDALITIPIKADDRTLQVEAFVSEKYVSSRMLSLFFMFFATFIFCIVIIIEMMKLPEMLDVRKRADFNDGTADTYEHISSGVRIASFLRTLANYMYLPYSAMLIKQWNQALGGMSVGVTAALPLTMESAGQVIGMMVYPALFKRPDKRSRWFFAGCLIAMLVINVSCFMTKSALTIIMLRFFGGLCYSGFMHVLNIVIAAGNNDEKRHQINLAQSNAGVIGGIMCGAGIGAIVAELAGYAFSYIISAVMFALFGWFVLRMMPWKLLEVNALREEKRVAASAEKSEKLGLMRLMKLVLSPSVLQYFLLVLVPMGFGILYAVTLIPSMVDAQGSTILLSYCYIVNGIAGFYFGPKLVEVLGKRMNNSACIMIALILAALGLVVLGVPPFMLMVLLSSTLLGVFDGFGTPMSTDGFLAIPTLRKNVNEVTSMAIYFALSNVVMVLAPIVIELITQGSIKLAVFVLAAVYIGCALLYGMISGVAGMKRKKKNAAV